MRIFGIKMEWPKINLPSWSDMSLPTWLSGDWWSGKWDEWKLPEFPTWETIKAWMPKWMTDPVGWIKGIFKRGDETAEIEEKLREGLNRALEKRPVGEEEIETLIEDIKKDIRSSGEREIRSRLIGEVIMKRLRLLDEVAFIRFASVYRRFEDITEFSEEVEKLAKD